LSANTQAMDETRTVVVTCEHASADVPADGPNLGVGPEVLLDHVSWDPGAVDLAAVLASRLGVELTAGTCSRLVADLNRSPDNPVVIPEVSFGVAIPGNRGLSAPERAARIARYHAPYWRAVASRIEATVATFGFSLHVSVHSFTPRLDPARRLFGVGLLFDPERATETALVGAVGNALLQHGWTVERNQPYRGDMDGIAAPFRRKFDDGRYACLQVEVNQRVMVGEWATRLGEVIAQAIAGFMRDRARRG
jgi:predicted N-formylglutamate amidohydrolase